MAATARFIIIKLLLKRRRLKWRLKW